jgi:AraC-like DNA-binding protein
MSAEPGVSRFAADRVHLPLMASRATFHWDGVGAVSRDLGSNMNSEPDLDDPPVGHAVTHASVEAQCQPSTGQYCRPALAADDPCLVPSSPALPIDWAREAQSLMFYLDPGLLRAAACDLIASATGELLWARWGAEDQSVTPYVHPVLLVEAASTSLQGDRIAIVPDFHAGDPLLQHITLVLQVAINAKGVAGRLYAESLTNALAVHVLRRYAASRPPVAACTGSLSKPKLRRTTAYIEAHLGHELFLIEIAAVAQTSPAHFSRQFRQATGQTPHHYVIMCRIERAKRLLVETALPIIDISHQVGFTDQSYFSAVFRKHVTTTPKVYRSNTQ